MLDLDEERSTRLNARAAAAGRELHANGEPIRWRGQQIATLPPEAPLAALAPLRDVDSEIALLLNEVMAATQGQQNVNEIGGFFLTMLATRENLPAQLIQVARDIAVAVIGEDGLQAFLDGDPSPWDVVALVRGAFRYWGITLGEASRSSASSPTDAGGPTSNAISPASTTLTSEASGPPPVAPSTSAFAAS